MKKDIATRLEELAGELRGEGKWPKFTRVGGEGVFEYSSPTRYRFFTSNDGWSEFNDFGVNVFCSAHDELPLTPAEAARLTGDGSVEAGVASTLCALTLNCPVCGKEEGGVERCEVWGEEVLSYTQEEQDEGDSYDLPEALDDPSFIGYLYENGDIDVSPRLFTGESAPARVPVAVLFRRAG